MRILLCTLGALALPVCSAANATTAAPDSPGFQNGIAFYPMLNRAEERATLVERLDALCQSKQAYDRQRCEAAWKIINDAKRELDKRRAASAAG